MGWVELIAAALAIISKILGMVKAKGPSEKAAAKSKELRDKVDKFKASKDPYKK